MKLTLAQANRQRRSPVLAWVRCTTRPVTYVTAYSLEQPLWSVQEDRENDCWRAYRGAGLMGDSKGRPRAFDRLEDALLACEKAALEEAA